MFRINGTFGQFPAFSLTGSTCELNCRHCRGRLLKGMRSATTPEILRNKLCAAARSGVPGVLISGGADARGSLPWAPFLPVIQDIKNTTSLFVCVHAGLAPPEVIRAMKHSGVDQILFDVIPDSKTYRDVFGLTDGFPRLLAMIEALQWTRIPTAPHFILGFNGPDIRREIDALEHIESLDPEVLVVLQFMPLPGTPMANADTATAESVTTFITLARMRFPNTEIALGCARRRPDPDLEIRALKAGVRRLALPHPETLIAAQAMGFTIQHSPICCAADIYRAPLEKGENDAEQS